MSINYERMAEFVGYAPDLANKPGLLTSLATTAGANREDVENAATHHRGLELASFLSKLDGDDQRNAWARLSEMDRSLAYHLGDFRPPDVEEEEDDALGKALGWIADTARSAGSGAMELVSDVLRPIDYAAEQLKHGQRAAIAKAREEGEADWTLPLQGVIGGVFAGPMAATGHDAWVRAWKETQSVKGPLQVTGDDYLDPAYLSQVRERYTPETFELGMRMFRGETQYDIVAKEADPQRAADLEQMMRTSAMQDVLHDIEGARLSMGRQIARSWLGLTPDDQLWDEVSGLFDGANSFFMDPTIVGAKATNAVKLGRYGMGSGNAARIDELFTRASVQRFWDGAVPEINTLARNTSAVESGKSMEKLATNYRSLSPGLRDQLIAFSKDLDRDITRDDVQQFFGDINNTSELMRGQSAVRQRLMLRKNGFEKVVTDRIRSGIRKPISWLEEGARLADRLETYDGPSAAAQARIAEIRGKYADEEDVLFQDPRRPDVEAMVAQVIAEDRAAVIGRNFAAARGDSVGRVRDRLPAVTGRVPLLRGQGARADQSEKFSRADRLRFRTAQTLSRVTERIATNFDESGRFNMIREDATEEVYRLARPFMTRHFARQLSASFNAADIAGKRNIMVGLRSTLFEASGLTRTVQGRALMKKYADADMADGDINRTYSPFGQDSLASGRKAGIWSFQQQTHVSMPTFKELHAASAKVGILSHYGDFATHEFLDKGMEYIKGAWLVNFRRPIREAGEEVLGHGVRYGLLDWAKGMRIARIVDPAVRRAEKEGFSQEVVEDVNQRITEARGIGVTDQDRKYLSQRSMSDLETYSESIRQASVRNDLVDRGTDQLAGRKLREITVRADGAYDLRQISSSDGARAWAHVLRRMLTTNEGKVALANIDKPDKAIDELADLILSDDWEMKRASSEIFREQKLITGNDVAAARDWAQRIYLDLRGHLSDPDGNLIDDLIGDLRGAVVAKTPWRGPKGEPMPRDFVLVERLKQVEVDRRPKEVIAPNLVHVDTAVGMIDSIMKSGYGVIASANNFISRSPIYQIHWLKMRHELQPWEDEIYKHHAAALSDKGREQTVSRMKQIESELAAAGDNAELTAKLREETGKLQAKLDGMVNGLDPKINAAARKRAVEVSKRQADRLAQELTLGSVDNAEIRSQFSVIARNMIPFQRAQEEFFRRWGRAVRYHPEGIRKAALMYEGLEHSGFIQNAGIVDEDGNEVEHDYFIYPGVNMAAQTMFRVGQMLGFNWAMTPMPVGLRGQVRFLNSGFDPSNVQPGMGPLVAAPVKALQLLMPESKGAAELERLVLGDMGAGRPFMASLLPTDLRRLYAATGAFITNTDQMESMGKANAAYQEYDKRKALREHQASAVLRSIQAYEAAGLTPPEGADETEVEVYKDRLMNSSRAVLMLRTAFGSFLPAPPEQEDAMPQIRSVQQGILSSVKDEYFKYAATMGWERAYEMWVRNHPDELPLLEGFSKSASGAVLPTSEDAGQFYEDNRDLFKQFPKAAPFLLPHSEDAKFDQDTYRLQKAAGLRKDQDFRDFYVEMKLSGYTGAYYRMREKYEAAQAEAKAAGNKEGAAAVGRQWDAVSKEYQNAHPLLKTYISQGGQRAADREVIADQVRRMADSGSATGLPGAGAIKQMVSVYDEYKLQRRSLGSSRDRQAVMMRDLLRSRYEQQMKAIAESDINAEMLYSRIFRFMED